MSDKKYFVLMENGKTRAKYLRASNHEEQPQSCNPWTHEHPPTRAWHQACTRLHRLDLMVDKPAGGPSLAPRQDQKANVKKVGIEHL